MTSNNLIVCDESYNYNNFDKIADQVKIVDVCDQEGIELRETENSERLVALCPLHKENTASFTVYSDTNSWFCYGCKEGGDPITLIEKLLGYDFKSACEHLGINLDSNKKNTTNTFNNRNIRSPLPKSIAKDSVNKSESELELAHKKNNKLLIDLGFKGIESNTHYQTIYQEEFSKSIKDNFDNVISNLNYSYPIYDKQKGNSQIKLTGNKGKNPDKESKSRFIWSYTQNKKPKDKLSYKGNDTVYYSLDKAGITSQDIPFYLQNKLPKDYSYLCLTEGEKDTEVLTQVLGLVAITNGTQLNKELLTGKLKQLIKENSNLNFIIIFCDNDPSGLKQAKEKFYACVNSGLACLVINPATKKPVINFDDNDIDQNKTGYDIADLVSELINTAMDRESLVIEINQIIRECYEMAIQFKQITEVKTENQKAKNGHIFEYFKYLNNQILDTTNPENYLIPDILPKGEFIQLIASPKVGKTLLAYDLIASLILGEDFLGYELKEENKDVILIQLDESFITLNGRLITRLGMDSCDTLHIVDKWKLIDDDIAGLEYCLDKVNPSLVVIDSLRASLVGTGIDENSSAIADPILRIRDMLKDRGITGIMIHHANKNKEMKNTDKSRGSGAISAAFYATWLLENISDNLCRLNIVGRCQQRSFDLKLDDDHFHFIVVESEDQNSKEIIDDLPVSKQLREKIPTLIPQGFNTKKRLLDHLKCNENTLRKVLNELIKQGVLVRKGNGKTTPAVYNLKSGSELIGSSTDQVKIKHGSNVDQAKNLDKSMDTENLDPVSDHGKEKVDQAKKPDQDNSLDIINSVIDPLDTYPTNNGSNISETLTVSNDPLDPSLDPLDPTDPSLDLVKKALYDAHTQGEIYMSANELSIQYLDNRDVVEVYSCLLKLVIGGVCITSSQDADKFRLANLKKVF